MSRARAWLCDFDGTIAPRDIGAGLIARFAPAGEPRRRALLERWKRDEIGSRELTIEECRDVRVSPLAALEFVRGFTIDPGFGGFVAAARARGDEVMVVSDGFDFYIHELLARAGIAALRVAANRARFADGGLVPEFPYPSSWGAAGGCGRCGNCKGVHARAWRERGFAVMVVGDGYSDRCAAREADQVFARGSLLEWCRETARAATPFEGFEALRLAAVSAGPPIAPAAAPAGESL